MSQPTEREQAEARARTRAQELAMTMRHQNGTDVSTLDVELLTAALLAFAEQARAEERARCANIAEGDFEHTCKWEECCADVRADDIAAAIRQP